MAELGTLHAQREELLEKLNAQRMSKVANDGDLVCDVIGKCVPGVDLDKMPQLAGAFDALRKCVQEVAKQVESIKKKEAESARPRPRQTRRPRQEREPPRAARVRATPCR